MQFREEHIKRQLLNEQNTFIRQTSSEKQQKHIHIAQNNRFYYSYVVDHKYDHSDDPGHSNDHK